MVPIINQPSCQHHKSQNVAHMQCRQRYRLLWEQSRFDTIGTSVKIWQWLRSV